MKRLVSMNPDTRERTVLATFRLLDGRVIVDADPRTEGLFNFDLLSHPETGEDVTPEDGKPYYDALDAQWNRGSFHFLETVPDE